MVSVETMYYHSKLKSFTFKKKKKKLSNHS